NGRHLRMLVKPSVRRPQDTPFADAERQTNPWAIAVFGQRSAERVSEVWESQLKAAGPGPPISWPRNGPEPDAAGGRSPGRVPRDDHPIARLQGGVFDTLVFQDERSQPFERPSIGDCRAAVCLDGEQRMRILDADLAERAVDRRDPRIVVLRQCV